MTWLGYLAMYGAAYSLIRIYVHQLERFADGGCTCRKGAWNPTCPRHPRSW